MTSLLVFFADFGKFESLLGVMEMYVIAEIGVNHDGSVEKAKKLSMRQNELVHTV